jgi:hypothetical protein
VNVPRTPPLARERFRALLESYGSRLANWPEGERTAAEALIAESPDAADLLAEHRKLDIWLDTASHAEPSAALMRRIAEIPLRHPRVSWWAGLHPRSALAALGAAAALGVLTGVVTPDHWLDDGDEVTDDDYAMTWNADVSDEVLP